MAGVAQRIPSFIADLMPSYITTSASTLWDISDSTRALLRLHEELARQNNSLNACNLIATHCEIVACCAVILANNAHYEVTRLLIEGALAHDIGTYFVMNSDNVERENEPIFRRDVYIQHGVKGYQLLRERGFDERIAQFARNHTGVGLTRDDCLTQGLNIPPADYMPETADQEIVMLADKFHTKSCPPCFVSVQTARQRCGRFGVDNLRRWDALNERYGNISNLWMKRLANEYDMKII